MDDPPPGGTGVVHSTHDSNIKGLNPAITTLREKMTENIVFCDGSARVAQGYPTQFIILSSRVRISPLALAEKS
jgi:hypothetical protein